MNNKLQESLSGLCFIANSLTEKIQNNLYIPITGVSGDFTLDDNKNLSINYNKVASKDFATYKPGSGLIGEKQFDINLSNNSGLKFNDNKLTIDTSIVALTNDIKTYKANSGLNLDSTNTFNIKLESNSGLMFNDNGELAVDYNKVSKSFIANSGLNLDNNNLNIDLANNSGLKFDDNQLTINIEPNSGLIINNNKLSIDTSIVAFKKDLNYSANSGLTLNQKNQFSIDQNIVSLKNERQNLAGSGLNFDNNQYNINLANNSSLKIDNDELSINIASNSGLIINDNNQLAIDTSMIALTGDIKIYSASSGLNLDINNNFNIKLESNSGLIFNNNEQLAIDYTKVASKDFATYTAGSGLNLNNDHEINLKLDTANSLIINDNNELTINSSYIEIDPSLSSILTTVYQNGKLKITTNVPSVGTSALICENGLLKWVPVSNCSQS